jgi:hypothetical protein
MDNSGIAGTLAREHDSPASTCPAAKSVVRRPGGGKRDCRDAIFLQRNGRIQWATRGF